MNFTPKSSRKQTAHEWLDYLRQSDGLGGILAKTENLAKLKLVLNQALDNLGLGHLSPKIEAGWRSGSQDELFILVGSASIANRLQQTLPSLINELGKFGLHCSSIKVKLKPTNTQWEVKTNKGASGRDKPTQLNAIARKSWEELLEKLAPESELHKTVEQLLRNKSK